jgi:hypothetical protein
MERERRRGAKLEIAGGNGGGTRIEDGERRLVPGGRPPAAERLRLARPADGGERRGVLDLSVVWSEWFWNGF